MVNRLIAKWLRSTPYLTTYCSISVNFFQDYTNPLAGSGQDACERLFIWKAAVYS